MPVAVWRCAWWRGSLNRLLSSPGVSVLGVRCVLVHSGVVPLCLPINVELTAAAIPRYAIVTKGLCLDTALQFVHELIYQSELVAGQQNEIQM